MAPPGALGGRPPAESEVPQHVQLAAAKLCARMGKTSVRDWVWDTEDSNWEVAVIGLTREAELDLLPDGTFSELELVYTLAELDAALPEVAAQVRSRVGERNVKIELSLRRVEHLDALPDLPLDLLPLPVLLRLQRRPLLLQLPLPLLQLPVQLVLLRPQQLLPLSLTLPFFLVELEVEGLAVLGLLLDDRDARLRRLVFVLSCG